MSSYTYPPPPRNVSEDIIKPTAQFRREVMRVVMALLMFIGVYLILLAASIGLAVLFGWMGALIVIGIHIAVAILLGIGLLGAGLMVLFFTIKFLFSRKKSDISHMVEISESEYPRLFEFVRNVSVETGTSFPKHIYLSNDVNAAVFYDSGFWSMFLPVRKNLVIGLGLVNMSNLSEFKSVIAHEFGHFSQQSMRAGSYVYHANKVIYNMLYENDSYIDMLQRWASVHRVFALCAQLTVKIIGFIQWVLRRAYSLVNKQYMRLSRQMEFNADAMSAKVAGSNVAIHILRRLEFADACYSAVLEKCNELLKDNYKCLNIYSQQRIASRLLAAEYALAVEGDLPAMNDADKYYVSYNRVNIDDQWASHPTREQREQALNKLAVIGDMIADPAWVLFPDAAPLQLQMTEHIYRDVKFAPGDILPITDEIFYEQYSKQIESSSYPAFYNGYYNGRLLSPFSIATGSKKSSIMNIREFFAANPNQGKKLAAITEDIGYLDIISGRSSGIKFFDFDGNKYRRDRAADFKETLSLELIKKEAEVSGNDEQVYLYFLTKAGQVNEDNAAMLTDYYSDYFAVKQFTEDNISFCNRLFEIIKPVYRSNSAHSEKKMEIELHEGTELFKARIKKVRGETIKLKIMSAIELPAKNLEFLDKRLQFLDPRSGFSAETINLIVDQLNTFANWSTETKFKKQKELLEKQLQLSGQVA